MKAHGLGHMFLGCNGFASYAQRVHRAMRDMLSLSAQNYKILGHSGLIFFKGPETMKAFLWQDDLIGVAKFVNMCLRKRSGWKARREGGRQISEKFQTRKISSGLVWPEET